MMKIVQVKSIRTWANELFGLRLHVFMRRHNFATDATPVCDTSKIDDNHYKNLNIETLVFSTLKFILRKCSVCVSFCSRENKRNID